MTNTGGKENKMKSLLKNRKALSPVVAAIILIAVTVAVSIAVAAWMGSLTIGFMETAEVTITDVSFTNSTHMSVSAINTGTSDATVTSIRVNGNTGFTGSTTLTAGATSATAFTVTGTGFTNGNKYSVSMYANDGTLLSSYTVTASGIS